MTPGLSFPQIVIICRTAQFFMHYFVGANYFWLLVEGIYLHTLLITVVLSERRLLQTYIVIGWGKSVPVSKYWLCAALLSQWRIFCKEEKKIWILFYLLVLKPAVGNEDMSAVVPWLQFSLTCRYRKSGNCSIRKQVPGGQNKKNTSFNFCHIHQKISCVLLGWESSGTPACCSSWFETCACTLVVHWNSAVILYFWGFFFSLQSVISRKGWGTTKRGWGFSWRDPGQQSFVSCFN